jgi:hypothetical protein
MTELDIGQVECYSGHTYAQEPRAIVWQGRRHSVVQIERRWQSPEGPAFCVSTETGIRFQLHYHQVAHRWAINLLSASTHTPDAPESAIQPQEGATDPTSFDDHNEDKEVPV